MSAVLEGVEHLERELTPEPIAGPAVGSLVLHGVLLASIVSYGLLSGLFHSSFWGNKGAGGAMQVNLVSNALPLPADQPVNQNVLATETPSQAPAEPSPKEKQAVDEKAIPILGKQKPKQMPIQKTQQHQQQPTKDNLARYGEQSGSSMPRQTMPQNASNGPAAVGDGDFASKYGWYVDQINRKMATSWFKQEVDPRTPRGTRVYIFFTIQRNGSLEANDVKVDQASGSPTLNRSCLNGAKRVDTFGSLPSAYNSSTLKVSYYCEY